ncbi:lipase [Actinorhabdospora filicis]|uniref:Lipase n=1 Tax=Actinorhabdospora filicis TaxID=1785913 RepID=A0A9W6WBE5_9ACTN|nr:lipase [Actinorhabdospora filicis]
MLTATGLAALAATTAAVPASAAAARFRPSAPPLSGPFPVGRAHLHLVDRTRRDPWLPGSYRELMISVCYPARHGGGEPARVFSPRFGDWLDGEGGIEGIPPGSVAWDDVGTPARMNATPLTALGRRPVLLATPGHFTTRDAWSCVVQDLASRGFVTVTVDHTYEVRVEFPDGRFPDPLADTMPADPYPWLRKTLRCWSDDSSTVLTAMEVLASGGDPGEGEAPPPRGLGRLIDPARIGVLGAFTGGGLGAMETAHRDERVRAVVTGDVGLSWGEERREPIVSFHETGLRQPLMAIRVPEEDPYWAAFTAACDHPVRERALPGAGVWSLADLQWLLPDIGRAIGNPGLFAEQLGTIEPRVSVRLQREWIAEFFARRLH